ncbi:hypothetical protein [Brumimicrobium mesophilum]|uniref:hypothetical protein n=1 Tax=Brumimicrobium mesophilum TaxID=392717 RepID=UPI000D142E86|nr:hypothetical protein [Brumimicrobium mesophilum]
MKNYIIFLFLLFQFTAFGQEDTLNKEKIVHQEIQIIDCAHSHICCQVGCSCCPNRQAKLHDFLPSVDERTNYPKNDGLTYNQYVGETIAGYHLADGWRKDTINGGFNKEIYDNPFIESTRFDKQMSSNLKAFKYVNGKPYTGRVEDTILISFTPDKIRGYLNGKPYYESKELTVILRGDCVNGMMQGRGILAGQLVGFGMYNNLKLAECIFEDGEIVGIVQNWDLNSIEFEINDRKIHSRETTKDYFEFIKLLELTEVTYEKGNSDWIERVTYNGSDSKNKVISRRKNG